MAVAEPGTSGSFGVAPSVSDLLPSGLVDGVDKASELEEPVEVMEVMDDCFLDDEVPKVESLVAKLKDHKCEMCGRCLEDLCFCPAICLVVQIHGF